MSKTALISVRVDKELKDKAQVVFSRCGLSMGDAITLFLNQIVRHQGLPFSARTPNQETIDAINEPRGGMRYASSSEMFDDILIETTNLN